MYVCLWPVTFRIWGVTKLVSEHGLEVDDSTRVHLAEDLCRLQMLLWGMSERFPARLGTTKINVMESPPIFLFRCDWTPKGLSFYKN